MNCSMPGLPVHHQLPEFTQTHVHLVCDAIQPSHPLSSPSPPAPNPSQHQGFFQWVKSSHEVAKVLEFRFSISPSNEHPGVISFRMVWLDLLEVQETLKSLLQHHSSKASILRRSAFFTVQLSHPYMTTGKTIALTRQTFVGKVMSLLLNMLSRLVISFLPRSKCLLISWLQSPSAVILEPPKESLTLFPLFPHLFPIAKSQTRLSNWTELKGCAGYLLLKMFLKPSYKNYLYRLNHVVFSSCVPMKNYHRQIFIKIWLWKESLLHVQKKAFVPSLKTCQVFLPHLVWLLSLWPTDEICEWKVSRWEK